MRDAGSRAKRPRRRRSAAALASPPAAANGPTRGHQQPGSPATRVTELQRTSLRRSVPRGTLRAAHAKPSAERIGLRCSGSHSLATLRAPGGDGRWGPAFSHSPTPDPPRPRQRKDSSAPGKAVPRGNAAGPVPVAARRSGTGERGAGGEGTPLPT